MTSPVNGYAEALFNAADKLNCVQAMAGELAQVNLMLQNIAGYLRNPEAPRKEEILRETFKRHISPLTLEFIILLIQRRQFKILNDVVERFIQLSDRQSGRVTVDLCVPFPPGDALLKRIETYLRRVGLIPAAKDNVHFTFRVILDDTLIGGFTAQYSGRRVDASLKTMVEWLSRPERFGTL